MNRGGLEWPEQRVDRLKQLWADGWSAAQVAKALGGFEQCKDGGRSAVLGKVHRLKLPRRTTTIYQPRDRRVPSQRAAPRPRQGLQQTAPTIVEEFAAVRDDDIPHAQRKQFMQLKDHHCRWIVGDPAEEGHFYCGGEADIFGGRPYCAAHAKRAVSKGPLDITDGERLRRSVQGKKNHVTRSAKAA